MTHSPDVAELAKALAKAQGEMEGARKDKTNPHFKSSYAGLDDMWDACRRPLAAHGIAVVQGVSSDGGPMATVETKLIHESGQWIGESMTMTATNFTPQAIGSVVTYLRRYTLSALVGVVGEDDDGNAASEPIELVEVAPPPGPIGKLPALKRPPPRPGAALPPEVVRIVRVTPGFGAVKGYLYHSEMPAGADAGIAIYQDNLKVLAEECQRDETPVTLAVVTSKSGKPYLKNMMRVRFDETEPPVDSDEIPF